MRTDGSRTNTISTLIKKGVKMDTIRIYGEKTKEYRRLQAAADLINTEFDNNYGDAEVRDVYWDYGGGIKWTTICFKGEYQALDPRKHEMITLGSITDFADAVREVVIKHREMMLLTLDLRYGMEKEGKH